MLTMHSVLKHGGLYWDHAVLPPDACRARFAGIQAEVARAGDDGWLVFGDVARYGNVTCVTNFLPRVRSALVFVPASGDPVLLANIGKRDVPAAKTITWVDDVRPFGRLPGEVIALVEEAGMTRARIGLAGFGDMPLPDWAAIDKGLPGVDWRSRDDALAALRVRKEDWEIAAIRRSAEIADNALALVPEVMRPGVSLREAIARIDRKARAAGAEDVRYLVASGPQAGTALRPVDDRVLAPGDTLLIYAALESQRYWAETARTVVLGRASDGVRNLHAAALRGVEAMRNAATPGDSAAGIANAGTAALGDAALAKAAAAYGFGNGIGLDLDEGPALAPGTEVRLDDRATLALRAVLHDGTEGAIAAQTVVLGDAGATALNPLPGLIEGP